MFLAFSVQLMDDFYNYLVMALIFKEEGRVVAEDAGIVMEVAVCNSIKGFMYMKT